MSKVFNMVGGGGGGGPTASIFVKGLSETDAVTATNGSKTKVGVWTQKPNPASHGLPDGYTQLEYIESTGTQYIDTGVVPRSTTRAVVKMAWSGNGDGASFGWISSGNQEALINQVVSSHIAVWCSNSGQNIIVKTVGDTLPHQYDISNNAILFDGLSVGTGNIGDTATEGQTIYLCAQHAEWTTGARLGYAITYASKIYDSSLVIRDFVPCKRLSDNAIGMYDLVSGTFFENSGTGEFIAGPEIPQTIGGFLISEIKDFGTWTVTATDGTKTATQDVLVDVITDYEIEMSLSA